MKKTVATLLAVLVLVSAGLASLPVSADVVQQQRYLFETEALPTSSISYYPGAKQDFYDYGNGVSGTYIRVENQPGVVGNYLELSLEIPQAGTYQVMYVYRIHPTSGINQLYINGKAAGTPRNFNDRNYGGENDMATCRVENVSLPAGTSTFRWETTALSDSGGDRITVDYITVLSAERTVIGYDDQTVFVSELDYFDLRLRAESDHMGLGGTLVYDKCSCGNQPILLNGVEYTKGLGLEPKNGTTAVLDIAIPEGAHRFQTVVGLNDHKLGSTYDQKNVVTILMDGVQVYQTEPLAFGHCETIDLPIPYGAGTLTIRNDCGGSSVNDHICFGDARFSIGSSNNNQLRDFTIQGGRTLIDGYSVLVLVPEGTDLSALTPSFTLADAALCDKVSGNTQDFTEPVTYQVTAQNGATAQYTVTVVTDTGLTEQETAQVEAAKAAIANLPQPVLLSEREEVQAARAAFEALSDREKLEISNYALLLEAETCIRNLEQAPIRIACVGDSITQGVGATVSYPEYLQGMLGEDYWVYNAGVSGTTVSKNGNYPYWSTTAYTRSKEFAPDYVLIMLGTNDAQVANWNNCKDQIEDYYRELIAQYTGLSSNPTIVLASPAWYYLNPDSERYTAINVTICEMVERLAREYGFSFVDISGVTADHADWFAADGIHPDNNGYQAIAAAFADTLSIYRDTTLQGIRLGDVLLTDFSQGDSVTLSPENPLDPEELTLSANGNVRMTTRTQGQETILEITVTARNGRYQRLYTLVLSAPQTSEPVPMLLGDLNGDGILSVTDVVLLRKAILSDTYYLAGDLNEDAVQSVTDVVLLRKQILTQAVS